MKRLICLFLLLILVNIAFAVECQYPKPVYRTEEKLVFYEDGKKLDYPVIEIKDFQPGSSNPFKVYNNHDSKRLWVEVEFTQGSSRNIQTFELYQKTSRPASIQNQFDLVDQNTIVFRIINDSSITFRKEQVEIFVENECLGKNDGEECIAPRECGGGYCVEEHCSNSETCFNNDCKCSEDEVQCDDAKRCVKKGVVPNDVKPECGKWQECASNYFDSKSGLCVTSPSQKLMGYTILGLTVGIIAIWYQKGKQKTLRRKFELKGIGLERKYRQLEEIKKKINKIEITQRDDGLQQLDELREEKELKLKEILIIEQEIKERWNALKPFPDPQAGNRLVVYNPYLGGYKCFYEKNLSFEQYPKSKLVHRWAWKKYNGRDIREGHHIHHKDGDKYNNDPRNLEEIEGTEHYEMHRKGI